MHTASPVSPGRWLASLILTGGLVIGLAPQAHATDLPDPPGTLTVVDFTGGTIQLDGSSAALGVAAQLPSGAHTISVDGATADLVVGPGCAVMAVAFHHDGPDEGPTFASAAECPIERAPAGQAIVRFVAATAAASTPTGLDA